MKVDILLSTYNGEQFLEEQLQSLFQQTFTDWKLIVRDDGSSDKTLDILSKYSQKPNYNIKVLPSRENLGSTLSFAKLLENSDSEYIMLCDQDDFWLPNKIRDSYDHIVQMEKNDPGLPHMVYCDLVEVDNSLKTVKESFLKGQKIDPSQLNTPTKLLALNPVAGCTTIINKRALDVILPIPSSRVIHDQWMAVKIARYGVVSYLNKQMILYRQHQSNYVGANQIGWKYFVEKLRDPRKQFDIYNDLISNLDFSVNVPLFLWYKAYFSFRRSLAGLIR